MTSVLRCVACGGGDHTTVLEFDEAPVFCNVLYADESEARAAATGRITLVQCGSCGLLMNSAFDAQLAQYAPGYENSLHHSDVFQGWARECAKRLVATHHLDGGSALEIGCGSGGFLSLLAEAGMAHVIGYDPSLPDGDGGEPVESSVEIHRGFYEASSEMQVDLALSRHVLEHVTDPSTIVKLLAGAAPEGVLYLEVPDATTMLNEVGIYDVIYEHFSYFTAGALQALIGRCGLDVVDVRTGFGGQYLSAEAVGRLGDAAVESEVHSVVTAADGFAEGAAAARMTWADRLARMRAERRDVVVWGAGSKGVTFVNIIEGGTGVSRLVDLNPLKHGSFVPVTAQRVVSPAELVDDPPAVVIVMNPMYRDEVSETVDALGITAEVVVA